MKLTKIHSAYPMDKGTFVAIIDIEWNDGVIETCHYGVTPFDKTPMNLYLFKEIAEGRVTMTNAPPPPQPKTTGSDLGGPDVIA